MHWLFTSLHEKFAVGLQGLHGECAGYRRGRGRFLDRSRLWQPVVAVAEGVCVTYRPVPRAPLQAAIDRVNAPASRKLPAV